MQMKNVSLSSSCIMSVCGQLDGVSGTSFAQTLKTQERGVRGRGARMNNFAWEISLKKKEKQREFFSPSKSTRPSPLRSTSRRISLISLLVTCSPISFFMASRSSVKLIWPSPLESNWTHREREREKHWGSHLNLVRGANQNGLSWPLWMHLEVLWLRSCLLSLPASWAPSAPRSLQSPLYLHL